MRLDKKNSFYLLLTLDSVVFNSLRSKLNLTDEQIADVLQDFRRLLLVVMHNFELDDMLREHLGATEEDMKYVEKMFEVAAEELKKSRPQEGGG